MTLPIAWEWTCLADSTGYLALGRRDRPTPAYRLRGGSDRDLRGAREELPEAGWRDIEPFETLLDEWIQALGDRAQACGPGDAYPYDISQHGLQLRGRPSPAYLFQLLVSLGFKEDHRDGTTVYKLFEELSAMAAGRYLGDSRTAVVFGSPRRDLPAGFRDAVAHVANLLREEGMRGSREPESEQGRWPRCRGVEGVPRPESLETDTVWPVRGRPALEREDTRTSTATLVQEELRRTDRRGPDSGILRPESLVGKGRKRRGGRPDSARPMPYLGAMFGYHGQST